MQASSFEAVERAREERAGRVRVEGARVRVAREARLFTYGVAAVM